MDRFTALDQYGLVLLKYTHDARKAVEQFSKAIALAPERLKSSDPEWAYVYWHRATAEQQFENNTDAEKDFGAAESSLREVVTAMTDEKNGKSAAYYHDLLSRIARQHASLLETEGKQ